MIESDLDELTSLGVSRMTEWGAANKGYGVNLGYHGPQIWNTGPKEQRGGEWTLAVEETDLVLRHLRQENRFKHAVLLEYFVKGNNTYNKLGSKLKIPADRAAVALLSACWRIGSLVQRGL